MTLYEVVKIIERCQLSSEQCWQMAVDTAEARDRAEFQADMDECDEEYDAAIDALNGAYDDYIRSARLHLENARRLEKGGGDDQHARRALEALDELDRTFARRR